MLPHLATFCVLLATACAPSRPHGVTFTFPGPDSSHTDPTGRFSVLWREASDSFPHQLLITAGTAAPHLLLSFARSVDGAWSPESRYLALTDHASSTDSEVIIWDLARLARVVTIPSDSEPIPGLPPGPFDRIYATALGWSAPTTLRLRVRSTSLEGVETTLNIVYVVGIGLMSVAPLTQAGV